MGALVAYEVFTLMKNDHVNKMPKALFLCSQMAPDKNKSDGLLEMNDDEICKYLLENNLISEVILQEDMREYMYSVVINPMRSDEYAADHYHTEFPSEKYDANVWVCYGNEDEDIVAELNSWETYFEEVQYIQFDGGHYFPWDDEDLFADEIKDALDL